MHLTYRTAVGVYLLLYALAFSLRPDTGIIAYIAEDYSIPQQFVIGLFVVCGVLVILLPVRPTYIPLLCFPLLLLVITSVLRASNDPSAPWSPVVAHTVALLGILRWAWARSKEGGSSGTP